MSNLCEIKVRLAEVLSGALPAGDTPDDAFPCGSKS